MPKTHISRSKIINAPAEKVFKVVGNLDEWEAWSPWMMMEPEATVTVAPDGQSYSWHGERVGEGSMAITESVDNQSARYDLTFLKPFKSHAKVGMDLKVVEGGTKVTWSMDSQLPFFLFFMKGMMEAYVGMDYERGLNNLKDYVEDGEVHSKLNFIGENDYAGCNYVGIKRSTTIAEMPEFMKSDCERLASWGAENGLNPAEMLCIYHDYNPIKNRCAYTAAIPYSEKPENVPSDFVEGAQAPTKLHTVEHVGPYEHLGNAWATMYNMVQSKSIKPNKKYHPFETYGNSPLDADPNDLITRVNFAVK
jgi:DNA gyrase inhibitor GyrI